MDFFDSVAFEQRLLHLHHEGRSIAFLIGAGLSSPVGGGPGVASVATLTARARALVPDAPDDYQGAMRALQAHRGPDAINRLIREAVLDACPGAPVDLRERAIKGDGAACEEIDGHAEWWFLRPGLAALGELVAKAPAAAGRAVLTTNFDPLMTVSLQRSGAAAFPLRLAVDGPLVGAPASFCPVVQAHGYWHGHDTLHSPLQLEQPRPLLEASLRRLFQRSVLVVLGYGGWSDGFTRALFHVLEDYTAFPDVVWAFYEPDEAAIGAKYRDLLEGLRPGAYRGRATLYRGIDADVVLPRVVASLGAPAAPAPPAVAVPAKSRSPFSPGAPIDADERFFGREAERRALEDALVSGQPAQILGERRMGKTSLLKWVQRRAPLVQKHPVAWVNAQGFAGRSPLELVRVVAVALGRVAELEAALTKATGPDNRRAEQVLDVLLPAVWLVDEADALADSAHGFDGPFLELLRTKTQAGSLVWVSASRLNLHEAFKSSGLTSNFLNDCRLEFCGQLEEPARRELLAPLALRPAEPVLEEAAGFPLLLQVMADEMVRGASDEDAKDRLALVAQSHYRSWWAHRSPPEQGLLKAAAGGAVVWMGKMTEVELRARGLLAKDNGYVVVPGAGWRRFVGDV